MRRWCLGSATVLSLGLVAGFGPYLLSNPQKGEKGDDPAAPKIAASKIAKVTIYPANALVTREVDVPEGTGLVELVVSPMPEQIVPSTMYSEGADGIRVLTTRFRTRQVLEDVSEERRKLEAEIEKVQVNGTKLKSEIGTILNNMTLLMKLEGFTDKTAVMSTEKGGLNGDTVITLVKYVMEQRQEKAKEILALQELQRQNEIQLNFLQRKMNELGGRGSGKQERDAVIVVDCEAGKAGKIRLNYLVNAVHWHPEYKLRAGKLNEDVQVDYLANLRQQSGEDWNQVNVTLSTAQPMLNATPPELAALQPILMARGSGTVPPMPTLAKDMDKVEIFSAASKSPELMKKSAELREHANMLTNGFYSGVMPGMAPAALPKGSMPANVTTTGTSAGGIAGGKGSNNTNLMPLGGIDPKLVQEVFDSLDPKGAKGLSAIGRPVTTDPASQQAAMAAARVWMDDASRVLLNEAAAWDQQAELMKTKDEIQAENSKSRVVRVTVDTNDGPSVTYHLPRKLTVPSRNDEQILEVTKLNLTPKYYYKAVPVLNRNVYRQADLVNKSTYVLLPGEATMFQGTDFVGRMSMPLVAVGEEFTCGFGVDPQLQIVRKLMDKTRTTQGGNQVLKYEYQILVSSFKNEPVQVQVWDRLPHGETETIGINLLKTTPELSKDGLYLREQRINNLLRWDLDVEANRVGERPVVVSYEFRMELDRQMAITGFQSK